MIMMIIIMIIMIIHEVFWFFPLNHLVFCSVAAEVAVASSTFQGSAATGPPLAPLSMDFPEWSSDATMEELSPTCQIPDTVGAPTRRRPPRPSPRLAHRRLCVAGDAAGRPHRPGAHR